MLVVTGNLKKNAGEKKFFSPQQDLNVKYIIIVICFTCAS